MPEAHTPEYTPEGIREQLHQHSVGGTGALPRYLNARVATEVTEPRPLFRPVPFSVPTGNVGIGTISPDPEF